MSVTSQTNNIPGQTNNIPGTLLPWAQDELTSLFLTHCMEITNCQDVMAMPAAMIKLESEGDDKAHKKFIETLVEKLDKSFATESSSGTERIMKRFCQPKSNFCEPTLCAAYLEQGIIHHFCDVECQHSNKNCVHPHHINNIILKTKRVQDLLEQNTYSQNKRAADYLDINHNFCPKVYKKLEPFFDAHWFHAVTANCLNEEFYTNVSEKTEILQILLENLSSTGWTEKQRQQCMDKFIFFEQHLDNYGEKLDISEKFFTRVIKLSGVNAKSNNNVIKNVIPVMDNGITSNHLQWLRDQIDKEKSNPDNFKNILEIAQTANFVDKSHGIEIVRLLQNRWDSIQSFKKSVFAELRKVLISDVCCIVNSFAFKICD